MSVREFIGAGEGIAELDSALEGVGPGTFSSLRVGGQEVQIDSAQKALSLGIGYLSDSDSEFDAVIEQSLARWLMKDSAEEAPSDFVGEVSALREVAQQENSEATEDTLMSAAIGDVELSGSGHRAASSD